MKQTFSQTLKYNQNYSTNIGFTIPETATLTSPYWLNEIPGRGILEVVDLDIIGLADTDDAETLDFELAIHGRLLRIKCHLVYKLNNLAQAESDHRFIRFATV